MWHTWPIESYSRWHLWCIPPTISTLPCYIEYHDEKWCWKMEKEFRHDRRKNWGYTHYNENSANSNKWSLVPNSHCSWILSATMLGHTTTLGWMCCIEELRLHPSFVSLCRSTNSISQVTSSPTKAPPTLDLNSPAPCSNRSFLGRIGLTIST
jgi:hypothetical protein